MTRKELKKKIADERRRQDRKYGFRQSAYINFKVESGYFFCIYNFSGNIKLTVKPMYADDLWWEIWGAEDNKNEPLSLRGTGAFSLSGQVLETYNVIEPDSDFEPEQLAQEFDRLFENVNSRIAEFLSQNPDADKFYPDEDKMYFDPDRLLYLIALIHNGRECEVVEIIKQARQNKHKCVFRSGLMSDSYTFILRWCKHDNLVFRVWHKLSKKLIVSGASDKILKYGKDTENREKEVRKASILCNPLLGSAVSMIVCISLGVYLFDLDRRTLYNFSPYLLLGFCLAATLLFLFIILRQPTKLKNIVTDIGYTIIHGIFAGAFAFYVSISVFEVVNYLFADSKPITTSAIVTGGKKETRRHGRYSISHHYTLVKLIDEDRYMWIDDSRLFRVPSYSTIDITYYRGLFGIDVFDDYTVKEKSK